MQAARGPGHEGDLGDTMNGHLDHLMHLIQVLCGDLKVCKSHFSDQVVRTRSWRSLRYPVTEVNSMGCKNYRLWPSYYVPNLNILAQSILHPEDPPSKQFSARAGRPVP